MSQNRSIVLTKRLDGKLNDFFTKTGHTKNQKSVSLLLGTCQI